MFADSHCHLDATEFDADRDAVLERAREAGVALVVNPGVDLASSRKAVELAQRVDEVVAAVGVHPNYSQAFGPDTAKALRELASQPKVAAIGEVGLDFYRERVPAEDQRTAFEAQLSLAAELDLPMVIHTRNAQDAVLETLEAPRESRPPALVLHAFSGGIPEARRALDLGGWLGIGGPVTYKNASALREVVAWAPLERLLLETDAPYLPPQSHRGRRNEPAFVREVAERVAAIKNLPVETVAAVTLSNARRLFLVGERT